MDYAAPHNSAQRLHHLASRKGAEARRTLLYECGLLLKVPRSTGTRIFFMHPMWL